jgi:hypothetical protein
MKPYRGTRTKTNDAWIMRPGDRVKAARVAKKSLCLLRPCAANLSVLERSEIDAKDWTKKLLAWMA